MSWRRRHPLSILVTQGDITTIPVDAIVNAANSSLRGGGGVDGAIHAAAGPNLMLACEAIHGGCPTGQVKTTLAFDLPAKYVIHAVGPVWPKADPQPGFFTDLRALQAQAGKDLWSCYVKAARAADVLKCSTISFPAISTGVYGYPPSLAAQVAVDALRSVRCRYLRTATLVPFDSATRELYIDALDLNMQSSI